MKLMEPPVVSIGQTDSIRLLNVPVACCSHSQEAGMQLDELAGLFPLMSEAEFSALKNDIQANGQREPIWLRHGRVIDGKHRFRACQELGIEPAYREYQGGDRPRDVESETHLIDG